MDSKCQGIPKETTIEDLPSEVMIPIFNYLPTAQLIELSFMSAQWKDIIDNEIGYEVTLIDAENGEADSTGGNGESIIYGYSDIASKAVQVCHVKFATEVHENDNELPLPTFKYPAKLKVLDFKAPVSSAIFASLITGSLNLTCLQFGDSSLIRNFIFEEAFTSNQLSLPNLKSLQIKDNSVKSVEILKGAEQNYLSTNILELLSLELPSIKELTFSVIMVHTFHTKEFVLGLLKFIQSSWQSLKKVAFVIHSIQRGLESMNYYAEFTPEEFGQLDWEKLANVKLQSLELEFGRNYIIGLHQWSGFLKTQNLQAVNIFNNAPVSIEMLQIIVANSNGCISYLEVGVEVIIRLQEVYEMPVDCTLFESCKGLRKLGLVGNMTQGTICTRKHLLNVDKIPKRVLALALKNLQLESQDIITIVCRLDHIVKLTLANVGTRLDFGVTLKTLVSVLETRKCHELIVKGINPVNWENHRQTVAEMGIRPSSLSTANFHTKFCIELNQYIPICP